MLGEIKRKHSEAIIFKKLEILTIDSEEIIELIDRSVCTYLP